MTGATTTAERLQLAAWLLSEEVQTQVRHPENKAICRRIDAAYALASGEVPDDPEVGEPAVLDPAAAVEELRLAIALAGEPVPLRTTGRNRADGHLKATFQRQRLGNLAAIAMVLIELAATPDASKTAPAPATDLARELVRLLLAGAAAVEGGAA